MRILPVLLLAACATTTTHAPEPPSHRLIADERAGKTVPLDTMLDALAKEDVVFLGETHLDDNTHRFELEVYEGLAKRRNVVLALEMFERDVQPALDDYLAGRIDEKTFFERSRPWQNYRSGYRPLIQFAKGHKLPVIASNAPNSVLGKVGAGGREAFERLPPEERALLAEKLYDNTDEYWDRVARAVRGHLDVGTGERLYSTQNLWDNTMGESCVKALAKYPGALVLHVNGGFHSAYRGGAAYQVLVRRPEARVAVVEAALVNDFVGVEMFGAADRADYVAYVLARARGPQDGFNAVTIFPELRYRLYLPPGLSSGKTPPLLVWLGDDGFRASDALAPLAETMGEDVAIAVIEPPYPMLADDLAPGGRWFTGETFDDDLSVLGSGIAQIVGYLLRNYPIDGMRVVLAGEGTGATVVAATALYERDLDLPAIASGPQRYRKLRMLALPGKEGAPGARRLLVLLPGTGGETVTDLEWWKKEAEDWCAAGLPVTVENPDRDDTIARVRATLGLPPAPAKAGETTALVLNCNTPRARLWAEAYARRLSGPATLTTTSNLSWDLGNSGAQRIQPLVFDCEGFAIPKAGEIPEDVEQLPPFRAEDLMDGRGLPLAAGPFGGTTILVVPKTATDEQRAAWKKLEETEAIKKKSKFARLVVLFDTAGGVGIGGALQAVKDAGRSVVLIVPAVFCADAEMMAGLSAEARPFEDILDLSYLPGLGGGISPPGPPSSK